MEPERVELVRDVVTDFVVMVRSIGPGFHPDTRGSDYVSLPSRYSAVMVDILVDDARSLGVDVYDLAIRALLS
jgi:hypothetical protein